ncbi:hypothetical protein GCM10027275_27600 [Rhabdobacter roseus]|uniref:DUF5723 domain-containing protein n=1 Tax=Rhabdobacter roseus TaxID=1655419 RepID=A0A840TYJ0_9BACT|nr:DUF5723 family protein [Rhabdobacter roseus]MBB5284709.1 hypothetical protein [Rhabdobacter roseus]
MKYLRWLLLLGTCAGLSPVQAQQVPGLQYSNYGGLYRATYNPAILGGSRYRWQINLTTLGSTINNRYFIFFGRNALLYPLLAPHSTDELYGRSRTMSSVTQGGAVNLASEIRWPSVLFSVGKAHGFAFQLRSRGFVQGSNIPRALQTMYFRRLDTPATPTADEAWGDFGLMQQSFSEASFSYGLQLINLHAHKLKVGGTLKRVFGARLGYLQGRADRYAIRLIPGTEDEKELTVENLAYESGYSHPNQALRLGALFNARSYAQGWGYDLGASYELGSYWNRLQEEDDARPGYLIRVAASLTDVGSIRYRTAQGTVQAGQQQRVTIRQAELETLGDEGADGFARLFPVQQESTLLGDAALPAALHLEVDVQLIKSFFLNVAQTRPYQAPTHQAPESALALRQPNSFTVTPRFEDEDSDFAFPISFLEGNERVSIGFLAHFGPLHVGFSNLNGLLSRKPGMLRATYAYLGFSAWKFKDRK